MRNGVKWPWRDIDKIGEASDAGRLSCLKQGWRKPWHKACLVSMMKRLWGTSEVGETYRLMEVASNAKAS